MNNIKDSGERRTFDTGAVRDIDEEKGRCDLLPLGILGEMCGDDILSAIERYIRTGKETELHSVFAIFCAAHIDGTKNAGYTAILEVSKHYAAGCKKYGERNWEKGIPLHSYIDSAVRHYLKFMRGDDDERHDLAFLWNILGALWTQKNKPEMIDLPFAKKE